MAPLFTDEIFDSICAQISDGIPLAEICRQDGMPGRTTVYDWMAADDKLAKGEQKGLSERFARARAIGEDVIAEDCLDIADDGSNDWMKRRGKDGAQAWELNGEHVQRSKLRIDTRLKLLAKWNPKKYGERYDVTTDGDKLPAGGFQVVIVPPLEGGD